MASRIIDCCSLINLYTGWKGLDELQAFDRDWYVAEAALKEAQYTREFDEDGKRVVVAINLQAFVESGKLKRAKAETASETDLYVDLASELDDGEAEALAIAKSRGLILLTDDAKANQVAKRREFSVQTLSTAEVLREWVSLDTSRRDRATEIVRRIETLARFRPRSGTEDFAWWQEIRGSDP